MSTRSAQTSGQLRKEGANDVIYRVITVGIVLVIAAIPLTRFRASFDYFRDNIPEDQFEQIYWPIDEHHNTAGYRVFAQGVAEAINNAQMLGP